MAQLLKSTKYFDLFGSLNPSTVRVSTQKFKRQSDLSLNSAVKEYENGADG